MCVCVFVVHMCIIDVAEAMDDERHGMKWKLIIAISISWEFDEECPPPPFPSPPTPTHALATGGFPCVHRLSKCVIHYSVELKYSQTQTLASINDSNLIKSNYRI